MTEPAALPPTAQPAPGQVDPAARAPGGIDRSDPDRRLRVAVVFGGRSSEHSVSCQTARGVLAALDPARYDVVPIGIARDGRWVLESTDLRRFALDGPAASAVADDAAPVLLPPGNASLTVVPPGAPPWEIGAVDVVFPLLHGPFGEDGTLQGLLEMAGVRYVGSGVLASAAAMDKHVAKVLLAAAGLPVGRWVVVAPDSPVDAVREQITALGLPVFVKPARAGSSFGISRVDDPAALDEAVRRAAEHDPKVLVEAAVAGRELECGVLGGADGRRPKASVVGEVTVAAGRDFYDFEAKYSAAAGTELAVPADLPAATAGRVRDQAVRAFLALGCEGLARVDFFLRPDGELVVNEVNTLPGFTEQSMFPRLWAASGVDYPSLVDRLVALAAARPVGLR